MEIRIPAKIRISTPGIASKELPLGKDSITIGSKKGCTVTVSVYDIAPEHIQIEYRNDGYYLVNLNARNPVVLNAKRIKNQVPQKLSNNDSIVIGTDVRIDFSYGSSPTNTTSVNYKPWLLGTGIAACVVILSLLLLSGSSNKNTCKYETSLVVRPNSPIADSATIEMGKIAPNCVGEVVFNLDGKDVAVQKEFPFSLKIETGKEPFSNIDKTVAHLIYAKIFDTNNNLVSSSGNLQISFQPPGLQPADSNSNRQSNANLGPSPEREDVTNVKYEARMAGIISAISGRENFEFSPGFVEMVRSRIGKYKKKYPDVFNQIKENSEDINREFTNNGIKPKFGYILVLSRSIFANKKEAKLCNIPYATLKEGYGGSNETRTCAAYTKDILGALEQNYLKTIASFGITMAQAGKLMSAINRGDGESFDPKLIDSKQFSEEELSSLADFFAAGMVSSSPAEFGLSMPGIESLE